MQKKGFVNGNKSKPCSNKLPRGALWLPGGQESPFSASFLLGLLWPRSGERFNVEDAGPDVEAQVEVLACAGTRLGTGPSQSW